MNIVFTRHNSVKRDTIELPEPRCFSLFSYSCNLNELMHFYFGMKQKRD